eukprot:CAMPEP_0172172734 /NCGR_PEP_ID=MMETSP1050-20130122/12622_1 /TAXON_ID=233186 /ORGANISM="Cryptomonas curvata, Strain CCAP979/52" /LENGTH=134 /DNA_ID=CAMNT_0012844329 /DNA_START=288 /DNA_END=688 /DNA_ORIENTATION=+
MLNRLSNDNCQSQLGESEEAAPGHAACVHPDDREFARARLAAADHPAGRRPAPRPQSARRVLAAATASSGDGRGVALSVRPRSAAMVPWEYTAAAAAATAATAAAAGQLHPRELGPMSRHIDLDLAAAAAAAAA